MVPQFSVAVLTCVCCYSSDGRTLPINRKQKVFPNGTLIIENVERQSDQATYTCVVQNEQGFMVKGNLEVQVMGKLTISSLAQANDDLPKLK